MSNAERVHRAAQVIDDVFHPTAAARKLFDEGLLVTDEMQAVLDAAADLGLAANRHRFYAAVDAYRATRPT